VACVQVFFMLVGAGSQNKDAVEQRGALFTLPPWCHLNDQLCVRVCEVRTGCGSGEVEGYLDERGWGELGRAQ